LEPIKKGIIMDWISENWKLLVEAVGGLVVFASVVVRLTPTEVDNEMLARLLKFFEAIALNNKPVEKKTK
jgi:hypothetical protein